MSRHKNNGFSQTSKKFDGEIKAQHQQSRNKQVDHPRHEDVENAAGSDQNRSPVTHKKNKS